MTARRSRRGRSWTAIPVRNAASGGTSAASTPNKYGARRTFCHQQHSHASRKEARRCDELHLLQKSRLITALRVEPLFLFVIDGQQVKHPNGRRVGYKPDFAYLENGKQVAEDVKSSATMTEASTLRLTLFRHLFPEIELRIV